MKTIAYGTILLAALLAMTGCGRGSLVNIHDAPDVCPNGLCPIGTEVYRKNGELYGVVTHMGQSLADPSKPAMKMKLPDDSTTYSLSATDTQRYFIKK